MGRIVILALFLLMGLSGCSMEEKMVKSDEREVPGDVDNRNIAKQAEFKKELKSYIDGNFGLKGMETSWYVHIKEYDVSMDVEVVVTAITDLPKEDSKYVGVRGAFLGFLNDKTHDYHADKLIMKDTAGNVLEEVETLIKP